MGRIITPKYILEIGGFTRRNESASAWKGRVPTVARLEHFVMAGVVSTMPGFMNETVGYACGVEIPSYARIRENKTGGAVMVEWKAAAFTVLPDPKDFPELMTMEKFWADQKEYLERTNQTGQYEKRRAAYDADIERWTGKKAAQ